MEDLVQSLTKDEGDLVKTVLVSLVASFAVLGLAYFVKLRYVEQFLPKYGFYLLFAALSYAIIMPSVKQVGMYKEFPCMSGMMIGMTLGMLAGFLSGFYVGATNGMFWGSVFGMALGIAVGGWNGMCCGVMGFMEGIMAGFMGGLMGAMTSVMMLYDNLKAAAVIVFIVSAVIAISLNFMIHKETKGAEKKHKGNEFLTASLSAALTAITIWIVVFGPRSVLFR